MGRKNKKGKGAAASTGSSGQSVQAGSGALEIGQQGGSTKAGNGALESAEPCGSSAGALKSTQLAGSVEAGTRTPHSKQSGSMSKSNIPWSSRAPVYVPRNVQPINNTRMPTKQLSDQSCNLKPTNTKGGSGKSIRANSGALEIGQPVGAGNGALESGDRSSIVGVTAALKSAQLASSVRGGTRAPHGKQSGSMSKSNDQPINQCMPMKQQSDVLDSLKLTKQANNKGIPSGLHLNTRSSSAQRTMLGKTSSQATQWVPKKVQPTKVQAPDVAKLTHATTSSTAKSIPAEASPSRCTAESSLMGAKQFYNRPGSNPRKEVMKYYRNSAQHGLD